MLHATSTTAHESSIHRRLRKATLVESCLLRVGRLLLRCFCPPFPPAQLAEHDPAEDDSEQEPEGHGDCVRPMQGWMPIKPKRASVKLKLHHLRRNNIMRRIITAEPHPVLLKNECSAKEA